MIDGVNDSERFVNALCEKAFLKLWTYPSPFGKNNKELCDCLIVCETNIIIISVKDKKYKDTGDEDWTYITETRYITDFALDYDNQRIFFCTYDYFSNESINALDINTGGSLYERTIADDYFEDYFIMMEDKNSLIFYSRSGTLYMAYKRSGWIYNEFFNVDRIPLINDNMLHFTIDDSIYTINIR